MLKYDLCDILTVYNIGFISVVKYTPFSCNILFNIFFQYTKQFCAGVHVFLQQQRSEMKQNHQFGSFRRL